MSQTLSISNPFYNYKILDNSSEFLKEKNNNNDFVVSYYVCSGQLSFKYQNQNVKILENQTVVLSSVKDVSNIQISDNAKVLEISSIKKTKEVIEIIDENGSRLEKVINDYKIIKNPKKVSKPWGKRLGIFG